MDGRLSGPFIKKSLIDGLISQDVDVTDCGMLPTPMLYFATKELNIANGFMITGSHNPKNYNGIKIILDDNPLFDKGIYALRDWIVNNYSDKIKTESKKYVENIEIIKFVVKPNGGRIVPGTARIIKSTDNQWKSSLDIRSNQQSTYPNEFGAPLDPRFTFDNFVVGKPNELAFAASQRVSEADKITFNPLFLSTIGIRTAASIRFSVLTTSFSIKSLSEVKLVLIFDKRSEIFSRSIIVFCIKS